MLRLPGQTSDVSIKLVEFVRDVEVACGRSIRFESEAASGELAGRIIWGDSQIVIKVSETLPTRLAEYVVAHELGHALQYARGYPIVAALKYESDFESLALGISSLVLDPSADSIAVSRGFPMALCFEIWLRGTGLLRLPNKHLWNGRRFGKDWARMWKRLEARQVCRALGLKMAPPPKEFKTLGMALEMATVIVRAANLRLPVGNEVREALAIPVVTKVVDDLVSQVPSVDSTPEECLGHLLNILDYFQARETRLHITSPLTSELFVGGQWKRQAKTSLIERLSKHQNSPRHQQDS